MRKDEFNDRNLETTEDTGENKLPTIVFGTHSPSLGPCPIMPGVSYTNLSSSPNNHELVATARTCQDDGFTNSDSPLNDAKKLYELPGLWKSGIEYEGDSDTSMEFLPVPRK